jgi:hypothetical protein
MARLFWLAFWFALIGSLLSGASWAVAYYGVGELLGAPPPQMGVQSTTFLWDGLPQKPGHPRVWRFAYAPTSIPGAPSVRIYVSPTGQVVWTEPGDLPARLKAFHTIPY